MDSYQKIKELNDLRLKGILTDEEFQAEKQKILASSETVKVAACRIDADPGTAPVKKDGHVNTIFKFLERLADIPCEEEIAKGIIKPDVKVELESISFEEIKIKTLDQYTVFDGSCFIFGENNIFSIKNLTTVMLVNSLNRTMVHSPLEQVNSYLKDNFYGGFSFIKNGERYDHIIKMSELDFESRNNLIVLIEKCKILISKRNIFDENILSEKDKVTLLELRKLLDMKIITEVEFNIHFKEIQKKYPL